MNIDLRTLHPDDAADFERHHAPTRIPDTDGITVGDVDFGMDHTSCGGCGRAGCWVCDHLTRAYAAVAS